jgi:hypothetical protein
MSQLYALLYKNFKIMAKQTASTLMLLLVPIMCLFLALLLQRLARYISDKYRFEPPFNVPFGAFYPINIPVDNPVVNDVVGIMSCLRMNKYAFTSTAGYYDQLFVDKTLNFNGYAGIRNSLCYENPAHGIISPFFNKTSVRSIAEMNQDLVDQMDKLTDSNLDDIQRAYEPTDGYYLFNSASESGISATLQSNNMINFFYHHRSLQTCIIPKGIPVG